VYGKREKTDAIIDANYWIERNFGRKYLRTKIICALSIASTIRKFREEVNFRLHSINDKLVDGSSRKVSAREESCNRARVSDSGRCYMLTALLLMEVPHCRPLMFPPTSAHVTYSLSTRGNCRLNVPRKPNAINCVYALEFNCPQLCAICSSCYMDRLRCYISSLLINIERASFIVIRTPIIEIIVNDQSTRILKLEYSYFKITYFNDYLILHPDSHVNKSMRV